MSIRVIRGCLLFLTLATASVAASGVTIARVLAGWRDAGSFKRIAEYFDGREHTGGQIVLRTDPARRSGYYFLVRVANPGPPIQVRLQLQLIEQDASAPRVTVFPAELKAGSSVFQLGLTDPAWQDPRSQPVAWQVLVLAADDGRVLVSEKSYLWEKPAVK